MTQEERELLERTAAALDQLWEHWRDTAAGLEAALLEIYRTEFVSNDRKMETLSRLHVVLRILEAEGQGAGFMAKFIGNLERWSGK
jgi:hypothetical protein